MITTLPIKDYSRLYSLNQPYLPMDVGVLIPKDDSVWRKNPDRYKQVGTFYSPIKPLKITVQAIFYLANCVSSPIIGIFIQIQKKAGTLHRKNPAF
jgi:hypothetical protein